MYFRGKQKQKVDVCIECISHSTAFRQCVQLTSMVRKLVLSCHSIAFDLLFLLSRRTSNASSTSFFFSSHLEICVQPSIILIPALQAIFLLILCPFFSIYFIFIQFSLFLLSNASSFSFFYLSDLIIILFISFSNYGSFFNSSSFSIHPFIFFS